MPCIVGMTILEQLGGKRFTVFTGASRFYFGSSMLQFSLPTGSARDGINKIRVELDPSDTYTLTAYRMADRGLTAIEVRAVTDVHCDELQDVFTRMTGLVTRL